MIEFSTDVRPSMALELDLHEDQTNQSPLTPTNLYALTKAGPAWAVRLDGKLVAVGGYMEQWRGRAIVWGYIGADAGPALRAMTKEIRRQCQELAVEFPRMEAYADRHHKRGNQWLKLLGFRREGLMRKFSAGRDYVLYARVT